MNLKPQFELFVNLARQQAESRESRNQADIRLFLFAIEIGLKRKLTSEEKIVYETWLVGERVKGSQLS